MKIAVIGCTGLLGRAIRDEWRGDELVMAGSGDVDIRHPEQVEAFLARHSPAWVVLAAAYTDVDGCEINPEFSDAVNHRGAVHVALVCRQHGIKLLFVSTDYVFDGTKTTPYETDDAVCPLSVYGRSKAEAEEDIRKTLPEACIARTSWLFGESRGFPQTILRWAEAGNEVRAFIDQRGCPNYSHDVAIAIGSLIRVGALGTVHVTNDQACSWFECALELLQLAGLPDVVVRPTIMDEVKRPAPRPRYSVLSSASLHAVGIHMRDWKLALQDFLWRRNTAGSRHRKNAAPCNQSVTLLEGE